MLVRIALIKLAHYSANKWTFARGALATIDRQFLGPIGWFAMHGICETHVAHHISSKIPHHNAWEATDALKEFLGVHYQKSDENMLVSFYKNYRDCKVSYCAVARLSATGPMNRTDQPQFVEDNEDVVFFKNSAGIARKVAVEESGSISDSGVDMTESK
jgi:omega-6 fatty acid desaturase (delta-12 desaturase)